MLKKILYGVVVFITLLLGAAIALPIIYKDKIKTIALEEINNTLNATVGIGDISLSLFRNFPNFSFGLQDFTVVNHSPFEGDTLARIQDFRFEIDIMSVFRGEDLEITSISIDGADLVLRMLADGSVNWDIMLGEAVASAEETPAETHGDFIFAIKKYSFTNINLEYDDAFYQQKAVIRGMRHVGSGDFTLDDFVLKTMTEIQSLDYAYEGVKYISKARGKFDVPIAINMPAFSFTFTDNDLYLNELNLKFAGVVAMPAADISMDIQFNSPQSDFRALLSVVPGVFNPYFENIQTSGKFSFDGKMKGVYNEASLPSFDFKLKVDNGFFQYPDLPAAVTGIQMNVQIANPNGDLDATVVDLKTFKLDLGNNPFSLRLKLTRPVSDPSIDAAFKGSINLAEVKDWYPLEEVKALKGFFQGDLEAKGRMSAIEQNRYNDFTLVGEMSLNDFYTEYEGFDQGIQIKKSSLNFNPQFVRLNKFDLIIGASDLSATGKIDNLIAYYLGDEVLKGSFSLRSNLLNINEMMGTEEASTSPDEPASDATALALIEIPANIDFAVNADLKKLLYDNMEISNLRGALVLRDQSIGFREVNMGLLGGAVQLAGTYSSKDLKKPYFNFNLGLQGFGLQETFNTFNTMNAIAPVGAYAKGKFSLGMGVEGILLNDMTPNLNTLAGGGFMKIPDAVLSGYKPLDKLAEALKMNQLKKLALKNVNLSFEFEEGRVYVQPFDLMVDDIKMTVYGSNGFDQSIDYAINMDVPREMLGGADKLMQDLGTQANSRGVNLQMAPTIKVKVKLTGSVTEPKIAVDLADITDGAVANLKQQALDELERRKKELENKAKEEAERLKRELDNQKKEAEQKGREELEKQKQRAQQEADKILAEARVQSDRIRAEGKRAADVIRKEADAAAKKLVQQAGNPIQKLAAEKAGDKLRKEANEKAIKVEQEANAKADLVMQEAQQRASNLRN